MREIRVRNLTSGDRLNRDCAVTERMAQGDYRTTVVRRCTYHVESQTTLPCTRDSIRWAMNFDPPPPRQVYVTKDLDPETGMERVIYKVLGHLYVVWGRVVFNVAYRHVLSMGIEGDEPADVDSELSS